MDNAFKKKQPIVQFRLLWKLIFSFFGIFAFYFIVDRFKNVDIRGALVIKDILVFLIVFFLSVSVWFIKMLVDANGIHHVFGIIKSDGTILGRDMLKTWDEFGIVIYNRKPFLAVALHENDLPFLWWFMMSGVENMLMIVGKYGMCAVVKEKDREYLGDLIKSE